MRLFLKIIFRGDDFGVELWCKYIMMKYQFDAYIFVYKVYHLFPITDNSFSNVRFFKLSNTLVIVEKKFIQID